MTTDSEDTNPDEEPHSYAPELAGLAVIVAVMTLVLLFVGEGEFGDRFGVANAVFTGLAVVGALAAFRIQRKELQLQRQELRAQRKEFASLADSAKEQAELQAITVLYAESAADTRVLVEATTRRRELALDVEARNWSDGPSNMLEMLAEKLNGQADAIGDEMRTQRKQSDALRDHLVDRMKAMDIELPAKERSPPSEKLEVVPSAANKTSAP